MPTVGQTTKPTASQEWFGGGQPNQIAAFVTMPEAGRVTHVGVWAAGKDAGASAVTALWRGSDGALLRQSDAFTMVGKSFGLGQAEKYERALTATYDAAAAEVLGVGFSRNPSQAVQHGYEGAGSHRHHTTSSWPAAIAGSDHAGTIGAYLVYEVDTVGEVFMRRAGAWAQGQRLAVQRAGTRVDAETYARRGGLWVRA